MKVYIAMYWGPFTESSILGVFETLIKAERRAEESRRQIQKQWEETWSNPEDAEILAESPSDKTGVVEYEVL